MSSRILSVSSSIYFLMTRILLRIKLEIFCVDKLPVLSQIILGGVPYKAFKSTKSESKVTTQKSFDLAN